MKLHELIKDCGISNKPILRIDKVRVSIKSSKEYKFLSCCPQDLDAVKKYMNAEILWIQPRIEHDPKDRNTVYSTIEIIVEHDSWKD